MKREPTVADLAGSRRYYAVGSSDVEVNVGGGVLVRYTLDLAASVTPGGTVAHTYWSGGGDCNEWAVENCFLTAYDMAWTQHQRHHREPYYETLHPELAWPVRCGSKEFRRCLLPCGVARNCRGKWEFQYFQWTHPGHRRHGHHRLHHGWFHSSHRPLDPVLVDPCPNPESHSPRP